MFERSLDDAALLTDAISAYDPTDGASFPRPRPRMLEGASAEAPVEPDFAWFDFPFNEMLDDDAREGMESAIDALGPRVERLPVAESLSGLIDVHITIHEYEFCRLLEEEISANWNLLSSTLKPIVERGRNISEAEYEDALEVRASAQSFFERHFNDFDAIIMPSATGEAPLIRSGGTGDPVYCRIASLAGLPALTLPLLIGDNGLPVGVQLIGAVEEDDRLLRTAAWMQRILRENS